MTLSVSHCRAHPTRPTPTRAPTGARGVVLLETVLAMTLFVTTAAVVLGALSASMRTDRNMALQATALDRAASVFARLRMGILPVANAGPNPCDPPFDDWTWQVTTTASGNADSSSALQQVHVTVRNDAKNYQLDLTELINNPDALANAAAGDSPGASP